MSPIVSEQYEFVIGVDTHAATHTFALVAGGTGAVLDRVVFPTTRLGCPGPELAGPAGRRRTGAGGRRGHRLVRCHRDRAPAGSRT